MALPLLLGAALALPLATRALATGGRFLRRGGAAAVSGIAAGGLASFGAGEALSRVLPGGGIDGIPRRRRRRRALTSDDMRIALTIASAISKKAAENFVLTRTRAS